MLVIALNTVGVEILGVLLVRGESVLSLTVLVIVGLIRRQKKEGLEFVGGEDALVEFVVLNETEVTADGDDSIETHGGRLKSGRGDPGPVAGPALGVVEGASPAERALTELGEESNTMGVVSGTSDLG